MNIYEGDFYPSDLDHIAQHSKHGDITTLLKAFLVELDESDGAKRCLTAWKEDNDHPWFNVRALNCFQDRGYNIYRLRPLGGVLKNFRLIYAYDAEYDDISILAVVEKRIANEPSHDRVYDYEPEHDITTRIIREYEDTGFPLLPRRIH